MPVHEDALHASAFIEKSHREGKPFFINLWLHEPHTPFHTVPKYRWRFRDLEERDNIYASVLSHADDRVGMVLDTLDRLDLAQHTLVIFSSDNGPARAAPSTKLKLMHDTATGTGYGIAAAKGITGGRKGYKASLFEGGIGVPFIARWPGRIAADKEDRTSIISAVDLLPTFCEIAGVTLPDSYQPDGVSQVDALMGKGSATREKPLFWKYPSPWPVQESQPYHWVSYAVVEQNWKLVTNKDLSYWVVADPYEQTDLKEAEPDIAEQLAGKIRTWCHTLPAKPGAHLFSSER
jgi:N-acetylgalactosamine-6-sulfatase